MISNYHLYRPAPAETEVKILLSPAEAKAQSTTVTAKGIIAAENSVRHEKTTRLREARLQRESSEPKVTTP